MVPKYLVTNPSLCCKDGVSPFERVGCFSTDLNYANKFNREAQCPQRMFKTTRMFVVLNSYFFTAYVNGTT